MFFKNDNITFNILDVLELKQGKVHAHNSGRNFCALSYRIKSDAVLSNKETVLKMQDNSIFFVPANLDYDRVAEVDDLIVVHFDLANYCEKKMESFKTKNPEKMGALFEKILEKWNKKETGYKYDCASVFYKILKMCYEENYKKEAFSKIKASYKYMVENFKNPEISIKEISEKSFMSEVYFRRLFKEEYGVSPQKYIINLRIQNAVGLISTGYYSLKEVAFLSGYTDYKYFSVEFKKQMGISPSEYKYNFKK
jgi:AraC-like DNA-binding protein